MLSRAFRDRLVLTILWVSSFLGACAIVIAYGYATDANGVRYAEVPEAFAAVPGLLVFYGSYLTAIFGFWYFRPWPALPGGPLERVPFWLALVTATALNGFILFGLSQGYTHPTEFDSLDGIVSTTISVALKISVLTAPANAFYFGQRES